MNRMYWVGSFIMLWLSCVEKSSEISSKIVPDEKEVDHPEGVAIAIDVEQSVVQWKGTKMRGAGKHEGIVNLESGYLIFDHERLIGGEVKVDMNTLTVTDIPKQEIIPKRNLNNHLKSNVFFGVEQYPIAAFKISDIHQLPNDSLEVTGILHIRDVSRYISIIGVETENIFKTQFKFNRFQWNIGYKGNWIDKTFVDKDIELNIEIRLNQNDLN